MSLEQLVQPVTSRPLHRSVEFWRRQAQERGGRVEVDFERKRDGLTFRPARLIVYIVDANDKRIDRSSEPWDEEVNEDLVSISARAVSIENEVERLGFGLKFKLEPVEVRYGDGYFNSMLILTLNDLGFGEVPRVAKCLAQISVASPSTDSVAYGNARQDIEVALREVGSQLTTALAYQADVAMEILANAVVYYLDERFHLTNRKRLGFI